MKKVIIVTLCIYIALTAVSCGKNNYKISAYSDLKKYTMSMSSNPGLPISYLVTGDDYDNVEIHCDDGKILLWNARSGAVTEHGDRLSFDKKDSKLYWSPEQGQEKNTNIEFIVYKDDKKVYRKEYTIKYIGDNMFSFMGDKKE